MSTYVIGDIHGNFLGFKQCLKRSKFNYKKDTLICLGDTADGFPYVKECFDELLKIKNLIYVLGNHDQWLLQWALYDRKPEIWTSQGGNRTLESYDYEKPPLEHINLLSNAHLIYHQGNDIFVHGGIEPNKKLENQIADIVIWDRDLLSHAHWKHNQKPSYKYGGFDNIYIGHTTTQMYHSIEPLHYCNVWAMDTGGGWSGKITIMNIDTKKYWQSDLTKDLYPTIRGR